MGTCDYNSTYRNAAESATLLDKAAQSVMMTVNILHVSDIVAEVRSVRFETQTSTTVRLGWEIGLCN